MTMAFEVKQREWENNKVRSEENLKTEPWETQLFF